MKSIAIVQSNYVPWKGYFDLIASVDELVLFDDMQYTRRDWRNRNRIKTPQGLQWLTIPVEVKGKYLQKICETRVSDSVWAVNHWKTLCHNYARAEFFDACKPVLEALYLECRDPLLSRINHRFLHEICQLLGIGTKLTWSMDYRLCEGKTERLVDICKQAGATRYLSGPSAREYLDEALFQSAGIEVAWMDYSGYRPYRQLFGPFEHSVSILDLLFNEGPNARSFLKVESRAVGVKL